jgi:hypothetical protein
METHTMFRHRLMLVSLGLMLVSLLAISAGGPQTEAVILYVVPGAGGKASVSATVGRGDFASAIKAP